MGLVKRTYTIEWDDELGPQWLGSYNLELCLHNAAHVGPDVKVVINDITECTDEFVERAKALLANPEIDEGTIIEAVARWLMTK
jgi:hypothetical protein